MSDRGYIALSLELEAKAIQIKVDGWKAENRQRRMDNHFLAYHYADFFEAEAEMLELAKKVRALAR